MKKLEIKTKAGFLISVSYFEFFSKSNKQAEDYYNIILIHAFPFDSEMFISNFNEKKFIDKYNKTAMNNKRLRIFIPDLPGFGKSDILKSKPKNLIPYVEAIKELVDRCQIERFYLGGCSMGGYISLEYFSAYPNDIEGLILMDTKPFADNEDQLENRKNTVKLIISSLQSYPENERTEIRMERLTKVDHKIKDYINSLYFLITSENTRLNNPKIAEKILQLMRKQKATSYIHALLGMAGRKDNFNIIKTAKIPILIIVGEYDSITPVEIAKRVYNAAEYANLEIISNAGHLSNLENRDQFNQILLNWIFLK